MLVSNLNGLTAGAIFVISSNGQPQNEWQKIVTTIRLTKDSHQIPLHAIKSLEFYELYCSIPGIHAYVGLYINLCVIPSPSKQTPKASLVTSVMNVAVLFHSVQKITTQLGLLILHDCQHTSLLHTITNTQEAE